MDSGTWTLVIGGVIGLGLALFGLKIWVTGQAPAGTVKAFRTTRDAGLYHLLFGVALVVLVAGTQVPGDSAGYVAATLAVLLAGFAIFRHRPQKSRTEE